MLKSDVEVSLSVRIVHFETNVTDTSRHNAMHILNDRITKNSLRAVLSRLHRIAGNALNCKQTDMHNYTFRQKIHIGLAC